MTPDFSPAFPTPFESGNHNQTTDWGACITFYEDLARHFPAVLRFFPIGVSDSGITMHAGLVSADGVFERELIHQAQRPVFFNNNGIHPGEPEGIDSLHGTGAGLLHPARAPGRGWATRCSCSFRSTTWMAA
jgi:hypothetical protein